jgi:hypothetical protein
VLTVDTEAKAQALLPEAKQASSSQWGTLVTKNSKDATGKGPREMAGDLGLVGPPGETRGTNPRVSEPVRKAVFELAKVGDVLDHVVKDDRGWNIVRLTSKTNAHQRSYEESERLIRITIVQKEIAAREKALEAKLRKKFPVVIDDGALAEVTLPDKAPHPVPHRKPPAHR